MLTRNFSRAINNGSRINPTVSVRSFSSNDNEYLKVLRAEAISANVKECEYAVRGAIPIKGAQIKARIENGDMSFPFKKIVPMNIGNPQAVGQGYI
jgi:hypothetical protein